MASINYFKFDLGTVILRCVNDRDNAKECNGLTEVDGIIGKIPTTGIKVTGLGIVCTPSNTYVA